MKRVEKAVAAVVMVLLLAGTASAALVDKGDGTVYDDVNNQYWIQDLAMFNSRSSEGVIRYYADQVAAIEGLSESADFGAYGQWRMATADDIANLYAYTAEEIYTVFEPVKTENRYYPGNTFIGTSENYYGRYSDGTDDGTQGKTDLLIQFDTEGNATYVCKSLTTIADSAYGSNLGAWAVVDAAPVPVPSALILLGSGLTAVVGFGRRRREGK